jgi:hypothetical protein
MNLQWLWCLFGFHPDEETERNTVGNADEYGHYKCEYCGRTWGHWDHA